MDLGFIRGPKKLKEAVTQELSQKQPTVQLSHDGYSAYLLIIDAATRYTWCFPLRSRSPPLKLIDKFLTKHGQADKLRTITTTPNGLLHKSSSFTDICHKYGYLREPHTLDNDLLQDITAMGLECPRYYIRTDNGNELAGSEEFCAVADKHHYIVETTAPDSSSQNGLGE
jgi:hypothetical protein